MPCKNLKIYNTARVINTRKALKSRQERDNKDVKTILSFLTDRNPFIEHADLRNIETGVTASKEVNVHQALEVLVYTL